jgi:type II secretory pathway component PulF
VNQSSFRSAFIGTVVNVGSHLFLWLVFVAIMIFYVPSRQSIFADYKIKVPDMTIVVLELSDWIMEFWFFLMPFLILFLLVADAPIYFFLRIYFKGRSPSRLWSAFMFFLPLAGLGIAFVALWLPYFRALERLSK